MSKMEEMLSAAKLNELIKKDSAEDKKKTALLWVMAIIGVVVAIAAIAYAIYRFVKPDYMEEIEDDFDEEFDDDFFDDDDEDGCGCAESDADTEEEAAPAGEEA